MKINEECSKCEIKVELEKKDLKPLNNTEKKNLKRKKDFIDKLGEEEMRVESIFTLILPPLPKKIFGKKMKKKNSYGFGIMYEALNIQKKWICPKCGETNYI